MSFFSFSNTNIRYIEKKLIYRSYLVQKPALLVTRRVKFIDKNKAIVATLCDLK